MSYIHYDSNGNKYGIDCITYNHWVVLKNGLATNHCDTEEEAQDIVDVKIIVTNKPRVVKLATLFQLKRNNKRSQNLLKKRM